MEIYKIYDPRPTRTPVVSELGSAESSKENPEGNAEVDRFAARWYEREANTQNIPAAQFLLGKMYLNGRGVAQDNQKSFECFTKGAEGGDAACLCKVGVIYHGGPPWEVRRDLKKAVESLQQATQQSYPVGQYNLGLCYENGWGVVKDLNEASKYYGLAAAQGVSRHGAGRSSCL